MHDIEVSVLYFNTLQHCPLGYSKLTFTMIGLCYFQGRNPLEGLLSQAELIHVLFAYPSG